MRQSKPVCATILYGVFLVALDLGHAVAEAPDKEIMVFHPEVFKEMKHGPVRFLHSSHKSVECSTCHHEYKDGKNVWKQGQEAKPCAACHKLEPEGNISSLERAIHRHCLGCHRQMKKDDKKTGPTVCIQCHPKKEAPAEPKQAQ